MSSSTIPNAQAGSIEPPVGYPPFEPRRWVVNGHLQSRLAELTPAVWKTPSQN